MGAFACIYSDPPWGWRARSAKGTGRGAVSHYDVMSFDALAALPVADMAAPDCALFLWSINSMLPQALDLIEAWGFQYKTVAFTWAKRTRLDAGWHFGLGYWTRQNTESCLLAVRGRPKRVGRDVPELVVSPVRLHSQKPDEVRERIERLVAGPYLELFARMTAPGWSSMGDQVGLLDNGPVATRRQPSTLAKTASREADIWI
jgi:N6-adenosine-specific RNA methylase IME4